MNVSEELIREIVTKVLEEAAGAAAPVHKDQHENHAAHEDGVEAHLQPGNGALEQSWG